MYVYDPVTDERRPAGIVPAEEYADATISVRCRQCGRRQQAIEIVYPEVGKHIDTPLCQACALADVADWECGEARCTWCRNLRPCKDMTRMFRSVNRPFAAEGDICASCLPTALIAYRRVCATCGGAFRVTRHVDRQAYCPACAATSTDWQAREQPILAQQLERARASGLPATLTLTQWLETLQHFAWRCAYCRQTRYEALDHFIPLSAGGGTTADNCVPACSFCNESKGSTDPSHRLESQQPFLAIGAVDLATAQEVAAYLTSRR
jgi:hypothetical protein